MSEKKYEVLDELDNIMASNMNLATALLLMEVYCEKYFRKKADLRLREVDE